MYTLTQTLTYIQNTEIFLHKCLHIYEQTFTLVEIHTYIHTYVHTYIRTYIPTCIHTYIHTYKHTYIQTYIHTYIHTYITFLWGGG